MNHAVLIVDDEPKVYQALRRSLHREPYELLFAEGAEQALKILSDRNIDVIIADENMPVMKGSVLLARVRQQWPDIVRMMLTGDARIETVVGAVNKGEIFRFFIKPANEAEMIVSIREALKQRALKMEATRLLETVRRQGEQLRAFQAPDADPNAPANQSPERKSHAPIDGAELPPIKLGEKPRAAAGARGGPLPKGVYALDEDTSDDVDKLLSDIRKELKRLALD